MGRISIRVFKLIDRQSGQENIAIVERWPLWGGFNKSI